MWAGEILDIKFLKTHDGKYIAIVDADDYPKLSQFKWSLCEGYFRCTTSIEGKRMLHVIVNKTPKGYLTDHWNRNPLDNRKTNLRTVTATGNNLNAALSTKNRSGVRGVYPLPNSHNRYNKWRASIGFMGFKISIGEFPTIEQAQAARIAFEDKLKMVDPEQFNEQTIRDFGAACMGRQKYNGKHEPSVKLPRLKRRNYMPHDQFILRQKRASWTRHYGKQSLKKLEDYK
jgi:hypothetical protein